MTTLYVTSFTEGAGKTAVCAGLAKHFLSCGKKVGFFKPIIAGKVGNGDSDALFMKQLLALDEPVASLCPVIGEDNVPSGLKQAYDRLATGKDVVIVEGKCEQRVAAALGAKAIMVEDYSRMPETKFNDACRGLGEYLLGIVVNKVPAGRWERVTGELSSQLNTSGSIMLGTLPEDRALFTLSVGELAGYLQGKILNSAEKSEELVENVMLGALTVDPGPDYFSRKANKAVVVSGKRADMQMAALETSMKCLILSGNTAPIPAVEHRARTKSIPIILVNSDTVATVAAIEEALDKTRFNQVRKLPALIDIMGKHFSFQSIYQGLGFAS